MIKIYTSHGNSSSRNAKKFLIDNNVEFEEVNITNKKLNKEEIRKLLIKCENGFDDILSRRSSKTKTFENIDNMKVSEVICLLQEYPRMLKTPIIEDNRFVIVGYKEDKMKIFIKKDN